MASMGCERKRVVVIGGGSGGSLAAKLLQDHADVVLIDTKEYFEITWANLRSMVEPSFAGRCIINHSEYLPNARVIVSAATDINGDEVVTAAGHRIPYDYLIIATGHLDPCALTRGERLNYFQLEYEKIISSNSILIVGGGPTGVELAGEIAVDFPEKKVTLVHRGTRLMEFVGPKASRKTLDWLTTKKVEVILGQSVNPTPVSDGVYETSGGETIRADCMFTCIGKPVGSSWLQSTMFKSSLDAKGRLMVEPNLRVKGYNNVFAIGDITDIPEIKQGYLANAHAELTAKNLKLLMAGGPESKMGTHKPGKALAFVSLGRNDAVAQILFITMIGCVPGKIKSKDLFVGKTRKQLGLKP